MTAVLLTLAMLVSPMHAPEAESTPRVAFSGACTSHSWSHPPDHIRVLRAHHRGSSVPKRVERWSMDRYVAAVMASGAWPNRVWESAKVGALAIRQYATWMALHTCRAWKGHRYDISDSEQYLVAAMRPGSHLPVRSLRAVRLMRSVTVTKSGRHIRTGWSGGTCRDGWHLCEDSTRMAAQAGLGWRRIVRTFLSPVTIHE